MTVCSPDVKLVRKKCSKLIPFVLVSLLLLFFGCNSLFYYPSNLEFQNLNSAPIQNFEVNLSSLGANGQVTNLSAHYFKSSKASDTTVLQFHGNAQNMTAHFGFSKWLLDHEFNVMTFDYQGYGKSDGLATREHTIQDGIAAIRYLEETSKKHISEGNKNPTARIVILGQSLGGAVATTSAALAQSPLVCAVVLESTFGSYRQLAQRKLAQFWLTWPLQWPISFTVTDEYAPVNFINKLAVPTLFLHGNADPAVPISQGRALYDVYTGPKEWIEIPNGGHTPSFLAKTDEYRNKTVAFARRACEKVAKD